LCFLCTSKASNLLALQVQKYKYCACCLPFCACVAYAGACAAYACAGAAWNKASSFCTNSCVLSLRAFLVLYWYKSTNTDTCKNSSVPLSSVHRKIAPPACIRQHTSAYVSIRQRMPRMCHEASKLSACAAAAASHCCDKRYVIRGLRYEVFSLHALSHRVPLVPLISAARY
jgi:hypothetical protein